MHTASENTRSIELLEKNRPQQQRAIRTYEAILSATGELLCEVGLERVSTNNIAERAGVTVPALYRYFPNKYAVLNALGSRLMESQAESLERWRLTHVVGKPPGAMLDSLYFLLFDLYQVTAEFPGGLEVMHGMQAMAPLQAVRLDAYWNAAEDFGRLWCEQSQLPFTRVMFRRARLAIEMGIMAVQWALEDNRVDPDLALRDSAHALRAHLEFAARQPAHEVI
jgi:AcrR family transcriptional regulator